MSIKKLEEAKKALEYNLLDSCMIMAYTAMFHAARALLYKDGIQEKSHLCLIIYLREKYSQSIPQYLIQSLDSFRKERHEALYGLDFEVDRRDATLAIRDAEEFVEIVEKLLK